jgi:hypothetical protein
MRKCFVISPIGKEGSPEREHADDVYEFIIKPAMEECGITPFRSDHLHESGMISEQMFRSIVTEDLCIAVLTGHNPNVFYELAVAQCASKPVIILMEKGNPLPFDIRDLRCVYYDLKPRPLAERHYVKEIIAHTKSLEAANWKGTSPIDSFVSLGANTEKDVKFFLKSNDYGTNDTWLELIHESREVCDLMGITLSAWKRGKGFAKHLAKKAQDGAKVRILLMHQENPALPELINHLIPEENLQSIRHSLGEMIQFFSEIAHASPGIEMRTLRHGCPHIQLTRNDERAVFVQHLYCDKPGYCPLWSCAKSSPLYSLMTQEFESLWVVNDPSAPSAGPSVSPVL